LVGRKNSPFCLVYLGKTEDDVTALTIPVLPYGVDMPGAFRSVGSK
jgi:hypothetical protein